MAETMNGYNFLINLWRDIFDVGICVCVIMVIAEAVIGIVTNSRKR